MRTRIRLLVQPESMRSTIDATQLENWLYSARNWGMNKGGVKGNDTYQIVCTGNSASAMDGAGVRWAKGT